MKFKKSELLHMVRIYVTSSPLRHRGTSSVLAFPLFIILCLAPFFPLIASAQNASPEQKQEPALYILLTKADISNVKDPELKDIYPDAEASLLDQVKEGLASRKIKADVVKSDQEISADPTRFVLVIKIEKIELGRVRPFGRTAKMRVSYSFQNKNRFELVRRAYEETSAQKWQNCVKSISGQIVKDVHDDLAGKTVPGKAGDNQVRSKPTTTTPSAEARLQELEKLKAKGLITDKEYETKRKEILKGL